MQIQHLKWRAVVTLTAGALALAACNDQRIAAPGPAFPGGEADISVDVSSQLARVGDRVAVGLALGKVAGEKIGALQGRLYFDPSRLHYIGQVVDESFVLVNNKNALNGELRVSAVNEQGFTSRPVVLAFEVRGLTYTEGLRYDSEELANVKVDLMAPTVLRGVRVAPDLASAALADAKNLSVVDWQARLGDPRESGQHVDVNLKPGEYRLNLVYGDANLSGAVNSTDALFVAQAAVGLRDVITGSDAPTFDAAVAGNVAPFNTPGLGEVGDANPPGLNADGTRTLTSSDVLAIKQFAVLLGPPVVGSLIPGRGPTPDASHRVHVAAGTHTADEHWTSDNVYVLDGIVQFTGGSTLTIDAGTRVEGVGLQSTQTLSALQIARDARIIAQGTPLQPIVFTCEGTEPKPKGCWGGVWIAGNATLNEGDAALGPSPAVGGGRSVGGCNQKAGEATNPQILYGGCNDADNSGTLQYAVIEYAGWTFVPDVELNGLSLGGVGSGTTIDHVQSHAGQDDAFEFFGGTVNVKFLVATAASDDNFDITFGFRGKAQFVIVQQDPNDGDKGLEADNTETAATFANTPRTHPQLWNFTIVGARGGTNPVNPANIPGDALHVRRGSLVDMHNWLATGGPRGMNLDNVETCANINTPSGMNIKNSIFSDITTLGNADAEGFACGPYPATTTLEADIISDAANSNQVTALTANQIMYDATNKVLPDFRLRPGQGTGGAAPPNDGFFDVSATYVGAVAPQATTKNNIPWYSGWTRGWFSATQP